jgi:hypothetical protein
MAGKRRNSFEFILLSHALPQAGKQAGSRLSFSGFDGR